MRDDQVHLLANLCGAFVVWIASLYVLWGVFDGAVWLRLAGSIATLITSAYLSHRVIPRLTNAIVEAVLARRVPEPADVLRAVKANRTGGSQFRWLSSTNDGDPVAFLATLERRPIVVPLFEGRNFVGRQKSLTQHGGWQQPYPVEAAQWFVECAAGCASIWDAGSTIGSFIEPAGASAAGQPCRQTPVRRRLAGEPAHELSEGDQLVTHYAVLVFGWMAWSPESARHWRAEPPDRRTPAGET